MPRATVLVADDDEDLRIAITSVLAADGYEVVQAANGTRALEILAEAADGARPLPDVVVLDFVMPGFSGLGILRVMRRFERVPPTIITSGFPDKSLESFARTLGAFRVLRKPIDEQDLRTAVIDALAHGGHPAAPTQAG